MSILSSIDRPADLKKLPASMLPKLAAEIRQFLITNVAQTGGHLGPNLGVVELTIALHRVFDSPADAIIFDTGHQAYVHKILTGRKDFTNLRHAGGLSGYPSRAESVHDVVENSHATTSLSWADGIARGKQLANDPHCVVAVIGDGALTGGMAWEALNNIAEDPNRPIVIVINDNGRSYSPTVGGFMRRLDVARKLDNMRVNKKYEEFLDWGKEQLQNAGNPGKFAYDALRGLKHGLKDVFFDAGIFDSLRLKYLGPVDGHDITQLSEAFTMAKNYGGPVVVHTVTEKGRGYKPAEENTEDHFHAVGVIHPETGLPVVASRFGWTKVFADEIVQLARKDKRILGVTAAMMYPVGLALMQQEFPQRVIDAGIAEQHAITMAAGLAHSGYRPIVALYATFLNRAFDQLLMDVALHQAPVTICLDRAGITGDDGPSHNGMWDLAIGTIIPGLHLAIPRDEQQLRKLLQESVNLAAPTVIRYPKGELPLPLPALRTIDGVDLIYEANTDAVDESLLIVSYGPMVQTAVDAIKYLPENLPVKIVDPRWALPISESLLSLASTAKAVVTVEDGIVAGGIGTEISRILRARGVFTPVVNLGIRKEFLRHDSRESLLQQQGIDSPALAKTISDIFKSENITL
ncbi:1-deoxy-D-xylulose-5-phosphate synthase [Arcanobacterium hippocoleae]|uniref:1-deoxy-D-xylulose-5-phosphate synthase n=1 Tax=Arcanobacterium hippocoleae TaxID=149017 RepID=A0ABU1T1T6_9ACTO|nr:1-deoxy-D-xylulose-5-phosphate synthase [Arcanobacterium hippocoleae]MDR6938836.1 1-deoxy-D-xylulose-5-phosphate synthase [Arcanobacterium hippocoleae]